MISITHITAANEDMALAVQLFKDYQTELGVDLCFQSFAAELENPLQLYGPPKGALLLAKWHQEPAGCIALKDLGDGICEMKRLYTVPIHRDKSIGKQLIAALLLQAKTLGYRQMNLDTLQRLQAALHLYKAFGFQPTAAYYHNPLAEVVYLEKQL